MLHAMTKDRGGRAGVAWFLAVVAVSACGVLAGCGPRARPDRPIPDETVIHHERAPAPSRGRRQVVIGELCPQGAAGRPAVAPLLIHTTQWIDAPSEVAGAVERGAAPRFVAFGVDGKAAGVFDTVGLADVGPGQSVAVGTFTGGAPCTSDAGQGQRAEHPRCTSATGGCGLAVAELAHLDDPPEVPAFPTGGACLSGDALGVDIDGDGAAEWFPLAQALDGIRGPAQEWPAAVRVNPACVPKFVLHDMRLVPEAEPGQAPDPQATVALDLLGVLDLDGDGRHELVIALRFPTVRTIAVYSATGLPQRLELAGEARSFQR